MMDSEFRICARGLMHVLTARVLVRGYRKKVGRAACTKFVPMAAFLDSVA